MSRVLRFGDLELDERGRELRRGGRAVELQAKPYRLLQYLVLNRDRTVPKQELLDQVWPDAVVSDMALSTTLKYLRSAMGDDGTRQVYIKTLRRHGYRFVAEVEELGTEAPEPTPAAPRRPGVLDLVRRDRPRPPAPEGASQRRGRVLSHAAFVGRAEELGWLDDRIRAAREGRPCVALVSGESGVGKTRLIREFAASDACDDFEVRAGRCHEDLTLPYLPFTEVVRGGLEAGDTEARSPEGLLQRLLGLDADSPPKPAQDMREDDEHRVRLFSAFARHVVALAQARPTLLLIEDLHWADRPTLDLLAHLAFALADASLRGRRMPLLIVATYRAQADDEPLRQRLTRVRREAISEELELAGLPEVHIGQLMERLGAPRAPRALVAAVSEVTRGNPLFIQGVTAQLVDRLGSAETTWDSDDAADLPLGADVATGIRRRVNRLRVECRQVLSLASLLGDRFTLGRLCAVAGVDEGELGPLLAEVLDSRLVLGDGWTFQFEHPSVRNAFVRRVSPETRRQLHRIIAEWLVREHGGAAGRHALEIAHHLVAAGDDAPPGLVADHASRAGDQAFAAFAWRQAALFYDAAARAAQGLSRYSPGERAQLQLRAALAYTKDNDRDRCAAGYERAIAGFREVGDARGLAWATLHRTRAAFTLASVAYGAAIDTEPLEEVLELLPDDELILRGLVQVTLSEVHWLAHRTAEAQDTAERALELGRQSGDDWLLYKANMQLGVARTQSLQVREALERWRACEECANRTADLWLQSSAGPRCVMALQFLGELEQARAESRRSLDATRRAENLADQSLALANETSLAVARGDLRGADRTGEQALALVERSHYPWSGPLALTAIACARWLRGDAAGALKALDTLVEPGRIFDDPGAHVRLLVAVCRLLVRARGKADRGPAGDLVAAITPVGPDSYALSPLAALVEVCARAGAPGAAAHPIEMLELAAERGVVLTTGWVFLIPRVLGVAAAAGERWDVAEGHFEHAIRAGRHAGALPELGRAHLDCARMLQARGRASDHERARTELARARDLFERHRMTPFLAEAERLFGTP